MTNAEIIATIRNEIERLCNEAPTCDDTIAYLMKVECFLDTLESGTTYDTHQYTPRPSVGIDDVARVQFASHAKVFDKKRKAVFDWEQFKEVAGIFYGFGKKDRSDTLESEKPMELEEEVKRYYSDNFEYISSDQPTLSILTNVARHFAEWGYLRAAEKYNEIEYNRQRAEESAPKDLEEAANKFAVFYDQGTCDGIAQDCFIAGAKWQAGQLLKGSPTPEDTVLFNKGVEEGRRLAEEEQADLFTIVALDAAQRAKEQMMKEAVEGEILLTPYPTICLDDCKDYDFKDGQKVRVIVFRP